jgi:hypothetical protein
MGRCLIASSALAATLFLMFAPVEPVLGGQSLESLTVSYNTTTCRPPGATAANQRGSVIAIVDGLSRNAGYQRVLQVGSRPGPFIAKFNVVPDAYYIQGRQKETMCIPSAGIVEIVLPGHPIFVKIDLAPCCEDALAFSYVAGFVAPGLHVRIVRSSAKMACGSTIEESALNVENAEHLSREGNAYYARISDVKSGTLVLELSGNGKKAFVRLVLEPNGGISTESTYKRIDVNAALFRQASANLGTLFCAMRRVHEAF